jgi:hypothetical protein
MVHGNYRLYPSVLLEVSASHKGLEPVGVGIGDWLRIGMVPDGVVIWDYRVRTFPDEYQLSRALMSSGRDNGGVSLTMLKDVDFFCLTACISSLV